MQYSQERAEDWGCSAVKDTKKAEIDFEEVGTVQKFRGEELERVAYDPESVRKFGGMVEWIAIIIFFEIIDKNHVHMR